MINYTLIRSNRRTLALYIRNGGVEVRAPQKMPKSQIEKFVLSKEKLIMEKLEKLEEQLERREAFSLKYGDMVYYGGKEYPITARNDNLIGFDNVSFYMPGDLSPEQIKHACIQIYRMLAKRDLTTKALYFAKYMNVEPSAIRISGARTCWGSCSAKKSLNFSWRLIMADDKVIDYVVVHELAHLTEMNHSAQFWSIVEEVLPDYRKRKEKLIELHQRLNGEDWD